MLPTSRQLSRWRTSANRAVARAPAAVVVAGGTVCSLLMMPVLPLLRPLFRVPVNGVGVITVTGYPKGWDYAVLVIVFLASAAGGVLTAFLAGLSFSRTAGAEADDPVTQDPSSAKATQREGVAAAFDEGVRSTPIPLIARRRGRLITAAITVMVAAAMLPVYDQPYQLVDAYHEGESLSPASVMMAGGRVYRDVFFMHGLATDGGLDLLVLGDPPNPVRARRLKAVLSAVTLALLVPIAAELSPTVLGAVLGALASLAALAAGELAAFPYFRLLPLLLVVWLTLGFVRRGKPLLLFAAAAVAAAGLLWSVDVGLFSVAGLFTWVVARVLLPGGSRQPHVSAKMIAALGGITLVVPLLVLLVLRADISRFFRDSFLRLPECNDACYSLPGPPLPSPLLLIQPFGAAAWLDTPAGRYYIPMIAWGLVAALAWRAAARGDRLRAQSMLLVAAISCFEMRTAGGRFGWAHTRMSVPLLGIALLSFGLEPLVLSLRRRTAPWKWLLALCAVLVAAGAYRYLELQANATYLMKYYSTYRQRLSPDPSYVRFRNPRAKDLFTYKQEADDLAALTHFSDSRPPGPIFDFSGEKDLYYMLARPASTRCHDVPYMADPALGREALHQLERRPPVFVVVKGLEVLHSVDGISYEQRTPWLARWIDERYPRRVTIGRFTVGLPKGP
jgi:hypothetical protein